MKFLTINIFLILLCVQTFSQDQFSFDWNGKDFINELKNNGIDSIYSVKSYCVGVIQLTVNKNDSICDHKDWRYFDLYIFWNNKGEKFAKKFNNCFEYEKVKLDSINFTKYFEKNEATIINERIESATGIEIENGDTTLIIFDVDHYCKLDLSFDINNKIFQSEIYDYDFETEINEYYGEQNKRLKSFTLYNQINNKIDLIERRKCPRILKNE